MKNPKMNATNSMIQTLLSMSSRNENFDGAGGVGMRGGGGGGGCIIIMGGSW